MKLARFYLLLFSIIPIYPMDDEGWDESSEGASAAADVSAGNSGFTTPDNSPQRKTRVKRKALEELNSSIQSTGQEEPLDTYQLNLIAQVMENQPTTPEKASVVKGYIGASPQRGKISTPQRKKVSAALVASLNEENYKYAAELFAGFGIKAIRDEHINSRHAFENEVGFNSVLVPQKNLKYIEFPQSGMRFAFIKDKESKRGVPVEKSIFPIMSFDSNFKLLEKLKIDFANKNTLLSLPDQAHNYGIEILTQKGAIKSAYPVVVLDFRNNQNQTFQIDEVFVTSQPGAAGTSKDADLANRKSHEITINSKDIVFWKRNNRVKSSFVAPGVDVFDITSFIKTNQEFKDLPFTRGILAIVNVVNIAELLKVTLPS